MDNIIGRRGYYSDQKIYYSNFVSIACIIIILEYVWFDYVMKQLSNCQF